MKKIAIIGTGGLGREVLGIIESINRNENTWDIKGFYDDDLSKTTINNYPVINTIESLNYVEEDLYIVIGIGNPEVKEKIRNRIINSNIKFPNLIHPSVIMYSRSTIVIGEGIVIGAGSILTVNIGISNFVYINTATIISHDVVIGNYSTIMPTVSISAGAQIGKKVYIGNGVKIDYPISINDGVIIKAGSILSK